MAAMNNETPRCLSNALTRGPRKSIALLAAMMVVAIAASGAGCGSKRADVLLISTKQEGETRFIVTWLGSRRGGERVFLAVTGKNRGTEKRDDEQYLVGFLELATPTIGGRPVVVVGWIGVQTDDDPVGRLFVATEGRAAQFDAAGEEVRATLGFRELNLPPRGESTPPSKEMEMRLISSNCIDSTVHGIDALLPSDPGPLSDWVRRWRSDLARYAPEQAGL
jgi:hypothetical protein